MGPVPETWRMFTEGRLQQLSEFKQGWAADEPGGTTGNPIHPWCLHMAKTLAYAIMNEHNARPYVMGCVDGGVSLEWCDRDGDYMITLEVPAEGVLCP